LLGGVAHDELAGAGEEYGRGTGRETNAFIAKRLLRVDADILDGGGGGISRRRHVDMERG